MFNKKQVLKICKKIICFFIILLFLIQIARWMNVPLESVCMELSLVFIYVFLFFLFELWEHIYPWKKRKIQYDTQDKIIKKPNAELLSKIDKTFHYIEPKSLTAVGVFALFIIELLNILCIYIYWWPSDLIGESETKIAVAVSAVSILFPVALLIVDNKRGSGIGLIHSQSLLSYSWSLPLGILLLCSVGRYSLPIHPYAGTLLAMGCVFIAMFVFYRLIKITLSPDIKQTNEIRVVKSQIYGSISRSIEERIGQNITNDFFIKHEFDGIEYRSFFWEDESKILFEVFPLEESGVIDEIHFGKLTQIYHKILSEISNKKLKPLYDRSSSDVYETDEQTNNVHKENRRRLEFHVCYCVGQNIETDFPLVKIYSLRSFSESQLSESSIENHKESIRECFKVDNSQKQVLLTEQFKEFCNSLRLLALRAAKESDTEKIEILKRYFEAWLESLTDAFKDQKVRYDLESAKDEDSYFLWGGKEWKPLKEIINIINKASRKSLKSDSTNNPEFAEGILELTNSLFLKMFYKNEILSCRELLRTNLNLCQVALYKEHEGAKHLIDCVVDNLESFFKFFVRKIEKKKNPSDSSAPSFEFITLISSTLQEYLRSTLLTKHFDLYKKLSSLVHKHPEFYKYKDIDSRFEILELHHKSIEHLKHEYNELKRKKEVIDKVKHLRREIALGQGILIMMLLHDKASNTSESFNENELKEYLKLWKELFPSCLKDALIFFLEVYKNKHEKYRQWQTWEDFPLDGSVYTSQFESFLKDFFYLVLLRAATKDDNPLPVEDEYLDRWSNFDFIFNDNNYVKKNIEPAIKMGLLPENWESARIKLTSYLEKYNSKSYHQWKEKLAQTSLDSEIINPIPNDFDKVFMSAVRLRRLMSFVRKDETSKKELSSLQCWGTGELYPRELLIKDSRISSTPVGTDYGSGLAESEDRMIFKKILQKIPSQNIQNSNEAIEKFMKNIEKTKEKDISTESIYLLAQGFKLIQRLLNNPNYRHYHQVSREQVKNNEIFINSDGFYQLGREKEEMSEQYPIRPDGFFFFEEKFIPVYLLRSYGEENHIIIFQKDSILIEQTIDKSESDHKVIPQSGFSFQIKDPLEDQNLKYQLISRDDLDYLKNLSPEEKEKLVPLYVQVNFQEIISVKINKNNSVFTGKLQF